MSSSGSLWIPTQQPFTKIFVALQQTPRVTKHTERFLNVLVFYCCMAEGAISSRFSMLHSSRNSRMGLG